MCGGDSDNIHIRTFSYESRVTIIYNCPAVLTVIMTMHNAKISLLNIGGQLCQRPPIIGLAMTLGDIQTRCRIHSHCRQRDC